MELVEELAKRYPLNSDRRFGSPQVHRTGVSEMVAEIPASKLESAAQDEEHLRLLRRLKPRSYLCVPLTVRDRVLGTLAFVSAESGHTYTPADLAVAEDLARRAATAIEDARLYAELREADRCKDDFLAMLAHELRNPLAPIRSGLELLTICGCERDTVGLMQEQVTHMVRLVDDLLDLSRLMRGKIPLYKESVPVQLVIQRSLDAVRPLIQAQNHELAVSLPPAPIWLETDPVRLAQIFTNLLNNAAKYTPKGGHIWLSVKQDGEQAVISVRDNGIGIDPELLPHVFDLFTQADRSLDRSQGGLGIGLTLVRQSCGDARRNCGGPQRGNRERERIHRPASRCAASAKG